MEQQSSSKQAENRLLQMLSKAVKEEKEVPFVPRWREGVPPEAQIQQEQGLGLNPNQSLGRSHVCYPSSAIGVLSVNGKPTGTAFIIGPKTIVTCASLSVPAQESQPDTALSFTPAEYTSDFSKNYHARKIHLSEPWKLKQNQAITQKNIAFISDFAVLNVDTDENLEEKYGSLGYDFDWLQVAAQSAANQTITIIGFSGTDLIHLSGAIIAEAGIVRLQCKIGRLSSGSLILQTVNGGYMIRGIYTNQQQPQLIKGQLFEEVQRCLSTTRLKIDLPYKKCFVYTSTIVV